MKRSYLWAVLALLMGFVLFCAGGLVERLSRPEPYRVVTAQRPSLDDYLAQESSGSGAASEEAEVPDTRPDSLLPGEVINVNTADVYDLQRLPNIGEKRAQDIIAWREEHGPFQTVDELEQVSGIGPAILEGLREFAAVE